MPASRTLTALVHDDDAADRDLISRQLRGDGFKVDHFGPDDCLVDSVRRHGADICIVGSSLGDLDAFEIARRLRHQTSCGVIVLSPRNDEVDAVLALEMGADDFVAKPIRPRELAARVRTVLRRTIVTPANDEGERPLPDDYLRRIDDMGICAVEQTVEIAGRQVPLTPMEYDVLIVLALHLDRVLSREQIITEVRGKDWAISDRVVDGIIYSLRRKLFPDGSGARRIRTVHGRGYMLVQSGTAQDEPDEPR